MQRWPRAQDLAEASAAEVLRAWGKLGYPRRALRLKAAAETIVARHEGEVPCDEEALRALPGVGRYTAAAVMAFAFRQRSLVLDVNIRRVLARMIRGQAHPASSETAAERSQAWMWIPSDNAVAASFSAAVMELGALVCIAKNPRCQQCPVADSCLWRAHGKPVGHLQPRLAQPWEGTNRQCRGRIMAALRGSTAPVRMIDIAWPDQAQLSACAESLVADGLATRQGQCLTLPA